MIIYLGVLLPTPSCNLPECRTGRAAPYILLGLAPDGVCLASDITATAGGLLHHRFTLTCRKAGNMPLCCTIRRVAPPGR